jgi:hypothetical protein
LSLQSIVVPTLNRLPGTENCSSFCSADMCALDATTLILGCNSRLHFNFLPNFQYPLNTSNNSMMWPWVTKGYGEFIVGRHSSNRISFRKKRYPQNTATCNTSLDFFHFSTRPVNIEGANELNQILKGKTIQFPLEIISYRIHYILCLGFWMQPSNHLNATLFIEGFPMVPIMQCKVPWLRRSQHGKTKYNKQTTFLKT